MLTTSRFKLSRRFNCISGPIILDYHLLCTMSFPFRHQPAKAIYTIGQVVYLMATLPASLILNVLPASRPRRSWPLKRVIMGRVARTWIDTTWKTSLAPPPPLPQNEQDANSLGFVWVNPSPELVIGEIAEIAKQNGVKAERVGGFWYGPRDSNDRVGQRASPGERVVYHLHGTNANVILVFFNVLTSCFPRWWTCRES